MVMSERVALRHATCQVEVDASGWFREQWVTVWCYGSEKWWLCIIIRFLPVSILSFIYHTTRTKFCHEIRLSVTSTAQYPRALYA